MRIYNALLNSVAASAITSKNDVGCRHIVLARAFALGIPYRDIRRYAKTMRTHDIHDRKITGRLLVDLYQQRFQFLRLQEFMAAGNYGRLDSVHIDFYMRRYWQALFENQIINC